MAWRCPPPVEAVPSGGSAGRGGDGTRAAALREVGFRPNPLGVVAEDNQELGRDVGAHPEPRPAGGRRLSRESREVLVVRGDFLGEGEPPAGQRAEGVLRRRGGRVEATRPKAGPARQQALRGEAVEGFSPHGPQAVASCCWSRVASSVAAAAWTSWTDRTVTGHREQAPIGSRASRSGRGRRCADGR